MPTSRLLPSATHRKRIRRVADRIAMTAPEHFDMSAWFRDHRKSYKPTFSNIGNLAASLGVPRGKVADDCGTAACVAGWTLLTFPQAEGLDQPSGAYSFGSGSPGGAAAVYLGLGHRAAYALFAPHGYDEANANRLFTPEGHSRRNFTPDEAANTLDRLADTGVVDWGVYYYDHHRVALPPVHYYD